MIGLKIFGWYLIVINVAAFVLMGADKFIALRNGQSRGKQMSRISEAVLLWMAFLFGACGILLGMLLFRHKIRKGRFQWGVPALLLCNAVMVVCIIKWFFQGN